MFHYTSKHELASQYFPHLARKSALNKLMSIINSDTILSQALLSTGYRPLQRHFTPHQMQIITDRIGMP